MKKHPLAVIVNFCTNESRFLKNCLEQALHFSSQVIVPVCDHFFDGTPENRPLLEEIYRAFPECQFIEYPYVAHRSQKKLFKAMEPLHCWDMLSRVIAYRFLDENIESILFLDVDEVPDGRRFAEWLECSDYKMHTVLKMANYWYFREACYQAEKWEDSIVLAQRRAVDPRSLLRYKEKDRDAIYDTLPGPKRKMVVGVDGQPMFHHYSWVRTEEEMLKKVRSWGHKGDRDWEPLVKKEFAGPFQGVDFVHQYRYKTIDPPFKILFTPPVFSDRGKPNVIRLSDEEALSIVEKGKKSLLRNIGALFSR